MKRLVLCSVGLFVFVAIAQADLIDFETGFADLQAVGAVATPTNTVTFSVTGGGNAFIAKVGDPITAFQPHDGQGTPSGSEAGSFFLTDEDRPKGGALDFFIDFARPVLDLSLNLYDYRTDGGANIGDTATLTAFADAARTIPVGTDVFTIISGLPDGNVETLSISNPSAPILAASLKFSRPGDVGNGIDNIQFTTVPHRPIVIDIKPGSDPNSINCNNENEIITVAILTTDDFDATTVDHAIVTFEGVGEKHVGKKSGEPRRHEEDVDGDGDIDLVLHFRLGHTALDCGSTTGALTGETFDGQAIGGIDAVRMIDRGGPEAPPLREGGKLTTTWARVKSAR